MDIIPHDRLRRRLHRKSGRLPLKGALELTYKCNLKCVHCYARPQKGAREMSLKQIRGLARELKTAGCLWLVLTGGEPLSRKDFLSIYAYLKKQGFLVSIFTNATLVTPRIAEYLAQYPPLAVEVSMYGLNERTYKAVTGINGAYRRCLRGIGLLSSRRIPLHIKMPVMASNKEELGKVRRYADKLGAGFRYDPVIHPRPDGRENSLRLSAAETARVDSRYQKMNANGCHPGRNRWFASNGFLYNSCGAGFNFFSIDPYGRLKLCMLSNYPGENICRGGFTAAWEKYFRQGSIFEVSRIPQGSCAQCKMLAVCDICPGWWKDKSGKDIFAPVPYLCAIAGERWKRLAAQDRG